MESPEIILICGLAEKNRVIGIDNKLPWYIPEDLKRFKRLTVGHAVIMGRKTFDSIIARNAKPLPDRKNIVLSRSKRYPEFPEVSVVSTFEDVLIEINQFKKAFVIGGEAIYKLTLPVADVLELTIVQGRYEGDAFFPEYEHLLGSTFQQVGIEQNEGYQFVTYKRI